jgi:hypothetical protein
MGSIGQLGDWGKRVNGVGNIDTQEFTRAYNNMKYDPGLISRITGDNMSWFSGTPTFLGETGASRKYSAMLDGVNARNYSAYFKEAAQGNMSAGEAEAILRGAGVNYKRAYSSLPFSFNNSTTGFMDELMESMSKEKAEEYASASTGANWYKNLDGTQANSILASVGIKNAGGMKADALLQAIVGAGDSSDAVGQFAAANGITRRQAAFGLTQKANGGYLSRLSMMHGASTEDFDNITGGIGALARATGNTFGADRMFEQGSTGLDFSSSDVTSALGALGLTNEDIQGVLATADGAEQLKQFAYLFFLHSSNIRFMLHWYPQ